MVLHQEEFQHLGVEINYLHLISHLLDNGQLNLLLVKVEQQDAVEVEVVAQQQEKIRICQK